MEKISRVLILQSPHTFTGKVNKHRRDRGRESDRSLRQDKIICYIDVSRGWPFPLQWFPHSLQRLFHVLRSQIESHHFAARQFGTGTVFYYIGNHEWLKFYTVAQCTRIDQQSKSNMGLWINHFTTSKIPLPPELKFMTTENTRVCQCQKNQIYPIMKKTTMITFI